MNKYKFEIKYETCKICGLVFIGDKEEHLNSDKDCQILQKKCQEEYKVFFNKWKLIIDNLNKVIKHIQNMELKEEDIKTNFNNLSFNDDKKYEDNEDHEMNINIYGINTQKFSSYKKEREIFKRFDRARQLFAFELKKKKLIGIEKSKLSDIPYKMNPEEEKKLWKEFTNTTMELIEEEVEKEFNLNKDKSENKNNKIDKEKMDNL